MKITCTCGATIHDAGDRQPGKAHLIPDRAFWPLMDDLDEIILTRCTTARDRDDACMHIRSLFTKVVRQAWQCAACGRLYVDDASRHTNAFAPEGTASKTVFA